MDLNEIVATVLAQREEPHRAAGIEVEFVPRNPRPTIKGDRDQLGRALGQIVENAEQAIAEHRGRGNLRVVTGMGPLGVQLLITDDGPGIASDNLERIFDPFWTTKDPGKGTGLGLSLVHNIVTEHGGVVSVRSTEGAGATFQIDLPAFEPAPTGESPAPARIEAPVVTEPEPTSPAALRVLIVDDEPAVRALLVRYLQRIGHEADEAPEGGAALRMLDERTFDVILTDLRMPGIGGEELVARLRAEGRGLENRVILMSGDATGVEESEHLATLPLLHKPVTLADVAAAVESRVASSVALPATPT